MGAVRATAEALRGSFPGEPLSHEDEQEIRGVETQLGALLEEFNRMADDYQHARTPIDFELADRNYQRGFREWRARLDRLLGTADRVLAAVPGADSQVVGDLLAPLRRLQQQGKLLKDQLARY
jgi:hypothetical protein